MKKIIEFGEWRKRGEKSGPKPPGGGEYRNIPVRGSVPDAQSLFDSGEALEIFLAQVTHEPTALTDELEQSQAGRVIFFITFEVLGQIFDPLGEQCDLYFRRTGIVLSPSVLSDDFLFLRRIQSHDDLLIGS